MISEKNILLSKVRDDIFNYPKEFKLFKNNNFSSACYKLSCFVEHFFIHLLLPENLIKYATDISVMQDQHRGAYRTALKWAFEFCNNTQDKFYPNYYNSDFDPTSEIILNAKIFNNIRNCYERLDLEMLSAEMIDENHLRFVNNNGKRSTDIDLYNRWIAREKLSETENKHTSEYDEKTHLYMLDPTLHGKWNNFSKKPNDFQCFKKIYSDCVKKITYDVEDYSEINFGEFNLEDFVKVYAVLMALGLMNINHQLHTQDSSPIIYSDEASIIKQIYEISKVKRNKIRKIIEILTYNPEFHKNKLSIFQPLFVFDKFIFYSPSMLYYSDAVDKLLYVYKEMDLNKQLISNLAKQREQIMTKRVTEYLKNNSVLKYVSNYKLVLNQDILAEFDIIIYDEECNKLLLTELKYYFKADGEASHHKVDQKIENAIRQRKQREKLAKEHIDKILSEAFEIDTTQSPPEIMSCIISQNYSGSSFLNDKLPVLDEFLFKRVLEQNKFNLNNLFNVFKNNNYIPNMETINHYEDFSIQYAGYNITYPAIVQ